MNCIYTLYLLHHANGQMHVCLIASSVKIITKYIAVVPIQVSQDGFMLKLTCLFLGCDLPIPLVLKLLSSEYDEMTG